MRSNTLSSRIPFFLILIALSAVFLPTIKGQVVISDSALMWAHMDLTACHYEEEEFEEVIFHSVKAMELAEKLDHKNIYVRSGIKLAKSYWKVFQLEKSIQTLRDLEPIIENHMPGNSSITMNFHYVLSKNLVRFSPKKKEEIIKHIKIAIDIAGKGPIYSKSWQEDFGVPAKIPDYKVPGMVGEYARVLGEIFAMYSEFDSAIYYSEISREKINESLGLYPQSSGAYIATLQNLGQFYRLKKNYKKGREYLLEARNFLNEDPNLTHKQRKAYNNLFNYHIGRNYLDSHDYQQAISYLKNTGGYSLADRYIGITFRELNENDSSRFYLDLAFEKGRNSNTPDPNELAFLLSQSALTEFADKNYETAKELNLKALTFLRKEDSEETGKIRCKIYQGMGDIMVELERFGVAEDYYLQARQLCERFRFERLVFMSVVINKIGELYHKQEKYNRALEQYQISLTHLVPDLDAKNWEALPETYPINYPDIYFDIIRNKIQSIEELYAQSNDTKYLKIALDHFDYLHRFSDHCQKYEFENISREHWMEKSNTLSQDYIHSLFEYAQLSKDDSFSEKGFTIADQNKANLLREALREADARTFGNLPEEVVLEEEKLRKDIVWHESKIFDRKESLPQEKRNSDSSLIVWERALSALHVRYQQFKADLAESHPEYFNAKYDLSPVCVSELKESLKESGETVVEYALTDSFIYIFVVDENSFRPIVVNRPDSLDTWIKNLREGTYEYWLSSNQNQELYQRSIKKYTRSAHKLFQVLVAPAFAENDLPERTIIIPDGIIGYIPFEALLTNQPKENGNFGEYPFLIKSSETSYAFSIKLHLEMKEKKINPTIPKILAIAPSFGEPEEDKEIALLSFRQDALYPLRYSSEEVQYLLNHFDAQMKTNELATKEKFIELAPYFRFIHLATHAKVHDNDPKFSHIAFTQTKDSVQDNLLYLSEIYNIILNAEMVVLSACETGIGELKKGEGIISMARAFAYAGAKSIVTSLWNVDDRSTSDIMKYFYHHLDHGERKSTALRNAKLDYLESNDNQASHPFFWAPMVAIGDMDEVQLNNKRKNWGWTALFGLGLIGVFFYRRKKK